MKEALQLPKAAMEKQSVVTKYGGGWSEGVSRGMASLQPWGGQLQSRCEEIYMTAHQKGQQHARRWLIWLSLARATSPLCTFVTRSRCWQQTSRASLSSQSACCWRNRACIASVQQGTGEHKASSVGGLALAGAGHRRLLRDGGCVGRDGLS